MMMNFIDAIKNILEERGQSINTLFENNIISKNTFYKYKQRNPSLKSVIKVANFLEVSIDYIYELDDKNNFKAYPEKIENFYTNLVTTIKSTNLSFREFCKRLGISKANIVRYRNGVEPNITTLLEIATFLNCTIDDLLI